MPPRLVLLACLIATPAAATDLVISDLTYEGFSYGYGNLDWQEGPTSTRIFSLDNGAADRGWGGVVRDRNLDLGWASDGRLIVDFTLNPGHATDNFLVHLNDADGRSGRWTFNVGAVTPGVPTQLTSVATISDPDAVWFDGGFINTPPDLTRITSWAIEGQWGSPGPFDVTLDNVLLRSDADPPPPYAGFAPNAPWRAEAATRIDAIRKADLAVTVVDAVGRPVPGAEVSVTQREHEFAFGTAVRTNRVLGPSADEAVYRQKLESLFNTATVENRFKWPAWEGDWGPDFRAADALATLDWLLSRGFRTRGHNLVWPGAVNLPQSINDLLGEGSLDATEQQVLREAIATRIAEMGAATSGKITSWDVVNEPRSNRDLMDALDEGDAAMADWFQLAAAADPNARLYVNDFGILTSGGGTDTQNQQLLESQAQDLLDAGAPIDGVGLQGHFSDDNL
ncbi:MAG: endo-1,4-beta-xylanase, partial [Planctomycetota bacterium]